MAPLPLHGQVRPIKVEQEQEMWPQGHQIQDTESQHGNLNSTPPILRRRARKRDAEDEKLDQVIYYLPEIDEMMFKRLNHSRLGNLSVVRYKTNVPMHCLSHHQR